MLALTALSDRPYDVDVWGRTSEPEWRVIAAYTYAVLLEARIGNPATLVECFQAWDRESRSGAPSADPGDARNAETWRLAEAYAGRVAKRLLDPVPEAEFVFRLKNPVEEEGK